MRISLPKTSFKTVVTCICIMLVDGGLLFGEDTFEHGLIGVLDIELTQMGQKNGFMFDVMIVNGITEGFRRFGID